MSARGLAVRAMFVRRASSSKTLAQAQIPVEFQAILNPPAPEEFLVIPPGFAEALNALPEVDASAFDVEAPVAEEAPEVGF